MSILTEGRYGEIMGRLWLKSKGFHVFQPDWISERERLYFTVEVKYQEIFLAPPFDGHGLPLWEVEARLAFQADTSVRAVLLVLDKITRYWYWQYLDVLEAGQHYDTNGKSPRRIYPVANFFKEEPWEQLLLANIKEVRP
jgi:hypothetical protein